MKLTINQLNEFIRDQVRRSLRANTNLGRLSEALDEDLTELFDVLKEDDDNMDEQAPAGQMPIAPAGAPPPAAPPPAIPAPGIPPGMPPAPAIPGQMPMAPDPFAVAPPAPAAPIPGMPGAVPGMPAPAAPASPAPVPVPAAAPGAMPLAESVVRRIVRQKVTEYVQRSGPVYNSERWKRLANIKK